MELHPFGDVVTWHAVARSLDVRAGCQELLLGLSKEVSPAVEMIFVVCGRCCPSESNDIAKRSNAWPGAGCPPKG